MDMAIRSTRRLLGRGLLGGLLVILGSGIGSVALAANESVTIASFAFSPQTVTVAVGDSVTWTNNDGTGHTATADDGSFDTGTIAGGASESATFTTAGTVAYHCTIHAAMTGTIVVTSATAPATDTLDPVAPQPDSTPLALLALAAVGGLVIGRRRFADRSAASSAD
jgi:MYXO-CTERM domain-containing protein